MLTYCHFDSLGVLELPFVRESAGDGYDATVIDCTSLNGNQGRSKSIYLIAGDTQSQVITLNLWFGSTRTEVEDAILNGTPAQLFLFSGGEVTLPIETEYFAIDYSYSIMQEYLIPGNFSMLVRII